jgi:hypothetical protein
VPLSNPTVYAKEYIGYSIETIPKLQEIANEIAKEEEWAAQNIAFLLVMEALKR